MKIDSMAAGSGRRLKENDQVVNIADLIEQIAGGVTLTGSKVCLSTEEKPAGQQGDTLLEYNPTTKESKVYKYISGNWREL